MNTEQNKADDGDLIDISRHLAVIRKRKWAILAVLAAGITLSVLYTMRQPKIFEAVASVEVEPTAPQVFGTEVQEVVQLGTGNYWANQEYYNTQIEMIRNYDLCHKTIELGQNDDGTATTKRFYDELVPPEKNPTMGVKERIDLATEIFQKDLTATLQKDTRVIHIAVRNEDRDLAVRLANAHMKTYKVNNMVRLKTDTIESKDFFAILKDQKSKILRDAEDELLKFQTDNASLTFSLEDRMNLVAADLEKYNSAYRDANIKKIELATVRARAQLALKEDVMSSPIFGFSGNTVITTLKDQYQRERQLLITLKEKFDYKHPEIVAQKAKLDDLMAAIKQEAELVAREIDERYKAAGENEEIYRREMEKLRKDAVSMGPLHQEYDRLKRAVEESKQELDIVMNRYTASDLSASRDQVGNNVKEHSFARPPEFPVLPRMKLNIALAAVISLMLGLALAFLLEYMDRTIKSAADVEMQAKAPVLGLIPIVEELANVQTEEGLRERDIYVFKHPASRAAECARAIRTNVLFSGADRELKVLTVSSPNPREGKSTAVVYLGTTMAQSGQRVLLVDTDMRRPRLHKSMGVSRGKGMSNLILGDQSEMGVTYKDVIKTTEIPNLYLLTCGPTPPNPAELLLTNRFKQVISELRTQFDWILFDSPPLNAVTDAVVLGRLSDGVILIAQAGKTNRDELARASKQLRDVDANVVGVILNSLDLSSKQYGYYYYAYNYGETSTEADGKA